MDFKCHHADAAGDASYRFFDVTCRSIWGRITTIDGLRSHAVFSTRIEGLFNRIMERNTQRGGSNVTPP